MLLRLKNLLWLKRLKELENDLSITREQLGRSSSSKLDVMLSAQKSSSNKTSLGYIEGGLSSKNSSTKFIISSSKSIPKLVERAHTEEILATRRIRVDLSDTKPKQSVHPITKKKIKLHP